MLVFYAVISNYEDSGLKEHAYRQPVCLQKPGLTDKSHWPAPPANTPTATTDHH